MHYNCNKNHQKNYKEKPKIILESFVIRKASYVPETIITRIDNDSQKLFY